MSSDKKMKKAARELRSLRHRSQPQLYDQKAEQRKSRLTKEYRRLKALESKSVPTEAESGKT